jgi:multidrug resistance efflux pump
MKRRVLVIGAAVLAAGLAFWIYESRKAARARYDYSGTVETREIQAGSKVGGRVTEVPVEEGQFVKAGSILVKFEADDLTARRQQAVAQMQQTQANLDKMVRGNRPEDIAQANAAAQAQKAAYEAARNGPRQQDIEQARAELTAAQADAANAQRYFARMQQLVAGDTISRQQFDDARNRRDSANARAKAAHERLGVLEAGTRPEDIANAEARYRQADAAADLARRGFRKEDIAAARAQVAAAKAAIASLDVSLREAEILAPADGVIETVSVRPGDLVPAGRVVVTMLETSQLWVRIYVPETDLARVHIGQSAIVRVDGVSRDFHGHVGMIAAQAEFLPRNVQTPDDREHQVFGLKVYVDDAGNVLKSGMSATVRLE